ncbi:LLM class flavin-dependent oxidoreductase [Rhodococcus coprophilus]|uniref:Nitrilotriacetate monooxygenase n=1 Tax=Rhodococcus coprophilus TaxID=38310 RepID=A0A2X4UHS8_9NOCA|nr:LLM class flavin-dependent oxidoreductase [Rhodococcus coprophilus]MBM7458438.1 alkanesulfonate monooxygenase SsuD/methylene tetrahydromethanopterin reductase-like flavin-dependent oxidoreductase (luciferase family) [Rhodococcus coprophilus]SQI32510.1 nitrilotriacetate monooxygenase [Rhodococcus coprophilus]
MSYNDSVHSDSAQRLLRVAVELSRPSGPDYWADLTVGHPGEPPLDPAAPSGNVIRVRATDLREAGKVRDRLRSEAAAEGRDPESVTVLVDLEVLVDPDARAARRHARIESAARREPGTLSYVGTPEGLASLIADIHSVGVADGVTLVPVPAPFTVEHLVDGTLPWLEARGLLTISPTVVEVLRRFGEGTPPVARAS